MLDGTNFIQFFNSLDCQCRRGVCFSARIAETEPFLPGVFARSLEIGALEPDFIIPMRDLYFCATIYRPKPFCHFRGKEGHSLGERQKRSFCDHFTQYPAIHLAMLPGVWKRLRRLPFETRKLTQPLTMSVKSRAQTRPSIAHPVPFEDWRNGTYPSHRCFATIRVEIGRPSTIAPDIRRTQKTPHFEMTECQPK